MTKESNSSLDNGNISLVEENEKTLSTYDINSTGLQYYMDKANIYIENKKKRDSNKTKAPSHTEKMSTMPGIGKTKSRR